MFPQDRLFLLFFNFCQIHADRYEQLHTVPEKQTKKAQPQYLAPTTPYHVVAKYPMRDRLLDTYVHTRKHGSTAMPSSDKSFWSAYIST